MLIISFIRKLVEPLNNLTLGLLNPQVVIQFQSPSVQIADVASTPVRLRYAKLYKANKITSVFLSPNIRIQFIRSQSLAPHPQPSSYQQRNVSEVRRSFFARFHPGEAASAHTSFTSFVAIWLLSGLSPTLAPFNQNSTSRSWVMSSLEHCYTALFLMMQFLKLTLCMCRVLRLG